MNLQPESMSGMTNSRNPTIGLGSNYNFGSTNARTNDYVGQSSQSRVAQVPLNLNPIIGNINCNRYSNGNNNITPREIAHMSNIQQQQQQHTSHTPCGRAAVQRTSQTQAQVQQARVQQQVQQQQKQQRSRHYTNNGNVNYQQQIVNQQHNSQRGQQQQQQQFYHTDSVPNQQYFNANIQQQRQQQTTNQRQTQAQQQSQQVQHVQQLPFGQLPQLHATAHTQQVAGQQQRHHVQQQQQQQGRTMQRQTSLNHSHHNGTPTIDNSNFNGNINRIKKENNPQLVKMYSAMGNGFNNEIINNPNRNMNHEMHNGGNINNINNLGSNISRWNLAETISSSPQLEQLQALQQLPWPLNTTASFNPSESNMYTYGSRFAPSSTITHNCDTFGGTGGNTIIDTTDGNGRKSNVKTSSHLSVPISKSSPSNNVINSSHTSKTVNYNLFNVDEFNHSIFVEICNKVILPRSTPDFRQDLYPFIQQLLNKMNNQYNHSSLTQVRELQPETPSNGISTTGTNCHPTRSMRTGSDNIDINTTNTPFETATNNSINMSNHIGNTMNNLNKYGDNNMGPPPTKKQKRNMSAGNKNSGAVVNVGGFNHGGSSSCINRSPAMSMTAGGHSVGRQHAQAPQETFPISIESIANNRNIFDKNVMSLNHENGTRLSVDSRVSSPGVGHGFGCDSDNSNYQLVTPQLSATSRAPSFMGDHQSQQPHRQPFTYPTNNNGSGVRIDRSKISLNSGIGNTNANSGNYNQNNSFNHRMIPDSNEWICEFCGKINTNATNICTKCDRRRKVENSILNGKNDDSHFEDHGKGNGQSGGSVVSRTFGSHQARRGQASRGNSQNSNSNNGNGHYGSNHNYHSLSNSFGEQFSIESLTTRVSVLQVKQAAESAMSGVELNAKLKKYCLSLFGKQFKDNGIRSLKHLRDLDKASIEKVELNIVPKKMIFKHKQFEQFIRDVTIYNHYSSVYSTHTKKDNQPKPVPIDHFDNDLEGKGKELRDLLLSGSHRDQKQKELSITRQNGSNVTADTTLKQPIQKYNMMGAKQLCETSLLPSIAQSELTMNVNVEVWDQYTAPIIATSTIHPTDIQLL